MKYKHATKVSNIRKEAGGKGFLRTTTQWLGARGFLGGCMGAANEPPTGWVTLFATKTFPPCNLIHAYL